MEEVKRHVETLPVVREQDRLLPIANINRIMKRAVVDNAKISKGAKETVQECVSEFIGFITCEASEVIGEEKRKTITAEDIMESLQRLGFTSYIPHLRDLMQEIKSTPVKTKSGTKRSRPEDELNA